MSIVEAKCVNSCTQDDEGKSFLGSWLNFIHSDLWKNLVLLTVKSIDVMPNSDTVLETVFS